MDADLDTSVAEEDDYVPYVPVKERKKQKLQKLHKRRAGESHDDSDEVSKDKAKREDKSVGPRASESLIEAHDRLKREHGYHQETEEDKLLKREEEILRSIRAATELRSVEELARGIKYTEPLKTSWQAPRHLLDLSQDKIEKLREKNQMEVSGEDVPPPAQRFADLKLAQPILDLLRDKGIKKPTPIQMQGLPAVLSGRDMIGIAYTGCGKSLCFILPMIMLALDQELKLPFTRDEGPFGIILCPSRELARQSHNIICEFAEELYKARYPKLNTLLAIGGIDVREQLQTFNNVVHLAVCTPGRLIDMLSKNKLRLDVCRFFCLDEADRMVDLGFEEDIRTIFSFFKGQRQTLLFSATMPSKIRDFAKSALVKPVTVKIGRTGAASAKVVQQVEYVPAEERIGRLLDCLQKTPPPVIIFSEKKGDVDDIHEYLLLNGVQAVGVHGSKDQEERDMAIKSFKERRKDVLVATDVASKGLDFPKIRHVINFDMPEELDDYVHRIGRTGRSGHSGLATTFINDKVPGITLLDLKYLLLDAKQVVPPFLKQLKAENEHLINAGNVRGCAYCGGLGHRITDCRKLDNIQTQQTKNIGSDILRDAGGAF